MKFNLSEAGKKIARRNASRLKAAIAALTEMLAEVGGDESKESAAPPDADLIEAILRQGETLDAKRSQVREAIRARLKEQLADPLRPDQHVWVWVRDMFESAVVYEAEVNGTGALFQVPYSLDTTKNPPAVNLGDAFEVELAYVPKKVTPVSEAADLDMGFVPLVEKAVRRDGTIGIKLIDPGWGSSGYYSAEVLKRDGPKVFTSGVKMFADHYTPTEEAERPEGSIKDLAATLTTTARWEDNGPKGPGLYADAKVFESWKGPIEDLAENIGISIRAAGRAHMGEAEGRSGLIVDELAFAKSVDFVTEAGRGGEILTLREAAKQRQHQGAPAPAPTILKEGKVTEEEFKALQESHKALEQQNKDLVGQMTTITRGLMAQEARTLITDQLPATLPQVTRAKLTESLTASLPTKDGALDRAALTEATTKAVKAEAEYLRALGGGVEIVGFGESAGGEGGAGNEPSVEDLEKQLNESFEGIGLSESVAKQAARGR